MKIGAEKWFSDILFSMSNVKRMKLIWIFSLTSMLVMSIITLLLLNPPSWKFRLIGLSIFIYCDIIVDRNAIHLFGISCISFELISSSSLVIFCYYPSKLSQCLWRIDWMSLERYCPILLQILCLYVRHIF